jgi:hypothetical protein
MKLPNIKNTLKNKLFDSPKPIDRSIYNQIFDAIFPGKKDFIKFLEEKNYEKCIDYAKKIILRICFESQILPPTRLFSNLLDLEKHLSTKKTTNFIGRDHFVHMVHLYLLGVYIYFHHKKINSHISDYFMRIKRNISLEDSFFSSGIFSTPAEDFIEAWKIFVLYHDVGYPWEAFSLSSESSKPEIANETFKPFLFPFNKLNKFIVNDISLKFLARLIAFSELWKIRTEETLERIELAGVSTWYKLDSSSNSLKKCPDTEVDNFITKWKNSVRVPRLNGIYSFRTATSIVSPSNVLAVLKMKNSELPIAFVFLNADGTDSSTIYLKKHYKTESRFI